VVAQVLQTAANVSMGENAAFEMLDYVISLREGIMDAWSGAILALKGKRTYSEVDLRASVLIFSSPAIDGIRGTGLHRPQCYCTGSKPKRSTIAVRYGRHWVSH